MVKKKKKKRHSTSQIKLLVEVCGVIYIIIGKALNYGIGLGYKLLVSISALVVE